MADFIDFISLANANVRYVVLGMIFLGASAAMVGCFTFLRKKALLGDAIAHSVLPGVCLAFMVADTKNPLVLLLGALLTGWLSLVLIDWISAKSRIKTDTAIGLILSVFFGFGILLLTNIQKSGNAAQSGLDKFLFGKAAALVGTDVYIFVGLSIILIGVILLFYRPFTLIAFDQQFAESIGLPTRTYELILSTTTVLAVAIGIQAVGVVLMSALLITPAASARFWTDKLWVMLLLAGIFGAVSGIFGAFVSYQYSNMPTGPWIVVILTVIAAISIFLSPQKGLLSRYLFRRANNFKMLEENILKLFFHTSEKENDFTHPKNINTLQQRRAVPKQKLSTGLSRLVKKGLLHKNELGWVLTASGIKEAKRIVRIHRLWELYLSKHLNIAGDHVHDPAEAIEHFITPELEKQLEELLEHPNTDPHNSQIPY